MYTVHQFTPSTLSHDLIDSYDNCREAIHSVLELYCEQDPRPTVYTVSDESGRVVATITCSTYADKTTTAVAMVSYPEYSRVESFRVTYVLRDNGTYDHTDIVEL